MVPQPLPKTSVQDEVLERIFCECLTQFAQKAQQQDLHTNVFNCIFCECLTPFANFRPQGASSAAASPTTGRQDRTMNTIVLITIFQCFPRENAQIQHPTSTPQGGRRGTRLPNQRGRAAAEQQDGQTDHPPEGGVAAPGTHIYMWERPLPLERPTSLIIWKTQF